MRDVVSTVIYPLVTNQFRNRSVSLDTFMTVIVRPEEFHPIHNIHVTRSVSEASSQNTRGLLYIIDEMVLKQSLKK